MATCAKVFYNGNAVGYLAKSSFQKYLVNGVQGFDENFAEMMNDTWTARIVDDMIIFDKRTVVLEFDVPNYVKPAKRFTVWLDKYQKVNIGDRLEFEQQSRNDSYRYVVHPYWGFINSVRHIPECTYEGTTPLTEMEMLFLPSKIVVRIVEMPDCYRDRDRCLIVEIEDYDKYLNGVHLFDSYYTVWMSYSDLDCHIRTDDKLIITKVDMGNGEKNLKAQVCGRKIFGFIQKNLDKLFDGSIPLNNATIMEARPLMTATIHKMEYRDDGVRLLISLDNIEY